MTTIHPKLIEKVKAAIEESISGPHLRGDPAIAVIEALRPLMLEIAREGRVIGRAERSGAHMINPDHEIVSRVLAADPEVKP